MSDSGLIRYLLGLEHSCSHRAVNDPTSGLVPPLGSPLGEFLATLYRFTFGGGLSFDLRGIESTDTLQAYLNDIVKFTDINSIDYSILENITIDGELLACPRRIEAYPYYCIDWVAKENFSYTFVDGLLQEAVLTEPFIKQNRTYYKRTYIDNQNYTIYPELTAYQVDSLDNPNSIKASLTKLPDPEISLHSYGFVPAYVLMAHKSINQTRATSLFNYVAIKTAAAIILLNYDFTENIHFFGHPLFASTDPEEFRNALRKRDQVVQKAETAEGGSPDILQARPLSKDQREYLQDLTQSFRLQMGVNDPNPPISGDVSSLTLKTIHSQSIKTSEALFKTLIATGLASAFSTILQMAIHDQVIASAFDLEIAVARIEPYFPLSPSETSQLVLVAQQLIDAGLTREQALKETIYPELSIEQISEKLKPNIEDY